MLPPSPTFLHVARHELRLLAAERTLWLALALFVAISGFGVVNGLGRVRAQGRVQAAVAAEESRRLADLAGRLSRLETAPGAPVNPLDDPRSPAAAGARTGVRYAILPPGPLAALAIGQSDLLPDHLKVTTQGRQTFLDTQAIENPGHLLAGPCDLGFVLVSIYPLLILTLSYDLLSSEREAGTLSLLLSQPVGLRTIVLGKAAARALIAIAPPPLLAAIGIALGRSGSPTSDAPGEWLAWSSVVLTYGAFWFALAMAANALGRGSAANALILASAWLALTLVIPSLVNLAASASYPVPSRVLLLQATREASIEANARGSQLIPEFFRGHPELAGGGAAVDEFTARSYVVQDAVERSIEPVLRRFDGQLDRQRRLIGRARFLSPAILAQGALQDISGTGDARHARFLAQVDEFHRRWRVFFLPRIFRKEKLTSADLGAIPAFRYDEESPASVRGRVAVGIAGILVPTIAIAGFGIRALGRYPIAG